MQIDNHGLFYNTSEFKKMQKCFLKVQRLEAVIQRCSVKKMFLEISQNSQKNTCARASFFNKVDPGTGVFL